MLAGHQKRKLKSMAHHLKPVLQVGAKGLTDSLISAINAALHDHELIKVKFVSHKEQRKDMSAQIAERSGSELINIIGNIAIFYKENPDSDRIKIIL